MSQFPKEPKKIKARISRYERQLRKEYEMNGFIRDGYGKRYLLGPLYLLLGDIEGAIKSFEWFEEMFPNDMGEPIHSLCWTLAVYRSGNIAEAAHRLLQTMLSNLYLIPHLIGLEQNELDIWHGSNLAEMEYLHYVPPEIWALWDAPALQWAKETYKSPDVGQNRTRYIEIFEQLKTEPRGPRRSELVNEAFRLQGIQL